MQQLFARQPALIRDVTVEQSPRLFRCELVDSKNALETIRALGKGLPGVSSTAVEPPPMVEPQRGVRLSPSKILLNLPKLIRAGNTLRNHYREQSLIEGNPRVSLVLNDDSMAIRERARKLSAQGREDDDAVSELSSMGKRHERDLKIAELASRERGIHLQDSEANRAHRLLQAAVTGGRVRPIEPQEVECIERCEQFEQLSEEEAFAVLCAIEPELRIVEADAKAGRLGWKQSIQEMMVAGHQFPQLDESGREEIRALARRSMEAMNEVKRRLDPLVGSDARQADLLLKTELAYAIAENWVTALLESGDP